MFGAEWEGGRSVFFKSPPSVCLETMLTLDNKAFKQGGKKMKEIKLSYPSGGKASNRPQPKQI